MYSVCVNVANITMSDMGYTYIQKYALNYMFYVCFLNVITQP